MKQQKWIVFVVSMLCVQASFAQDNSVDFPLLVIGASYSEGKTPYNNGIAPRGGISVASGSFLSLGQALTRHKKLPGFVVNEAQAGATTFTRPFCPPSAPSCTAAVWEGYQVQLQKALTRVALPPTFTQYNAKYVVITTANDCLHPGASGIPQPQSLPCTQAQLNEVVDRLIAVGRFALTKGVTPVYDVWPRYERLDLELFRQQNNLQWVISEADYNLLRDLGRQRIAAEFPEALVIDMWRRFVHVGDGIHPDYGSVEDAADIVVKALRKAD